MPGHLESLCCKINEQMAMTWYDLAQYGIIRRLSNKGPTAVHWLFRCQTPALQLPEASLQQSLQVCFFKIVLQIFEVKQFDYIRRTLGVTEDRPIQSWISSLWSFLSLKSCFSWARISLPWKGRAKARASSPQRSESLRYTEIPISHNIQHVCTKTQL